MEKYFEINYTIEDIQGMSREEQLEYPKIRNYHPIHD